MASVIITHRQQCTSYASPLVIMAAEPQPGTLSAAFPAPPPFYKSFTTENLEQFQQTLQKADSATQGIASPDSLDPGKLDLTSLSPELRHLVPPAPPPDGQFRSFGISYDIRPPSTSSQRVPIRDALLSLNDRLLQLYLRYVQILGTNPSGRLWVPQWQEIRKTFEEMHTIINEYRPHQARETLILMMEDQIKQFQEETERLKASVAKAKQAMESLSNGTEDNVAKATINENHGTNGETQSTEQSSRKHPTAKHDMWQVIENAVGSP